MSAIVLIAPVVVAAWPMISAAVGSAAAALGYSLLQGKETGTVRVERDSQVELEVENSEVVGESLRAEEQIVLRKNDVTIIFSKDPRGRCRICARGKGRTREELKERGREFMREFIQRYVHDRVKKELSARGFTVVSEETRADQSIHIRVRKWTPA